METKIVYVCGENSSEAEIMEQHKVLAKNGFVAVSYGQIKDFNEEKEEILKMINSADIVWVVNTNKEVGALLQKQIEIAQQLQKKIVYVY